MQAVAGTKPMIWRKESPPAETRSAVRGFDDYEIHLGDILRGERATLGKSLLDVQRELHIRAAHIAAIENGDLSAFEAPSFVAGFVRSYARYLGLDPEAVYEHFCIEHGFSVAPTMGGTPHASPAALRHVEPVKSSGAIKAVGFLPDPDPFWRRVEPGALGSITILIALIGGLGFAGWTVLQEVQRVQVAPADAMPTVASDLNPLAGESMGGGASRIDTDPLTSAPGTGVASLGAVGQVRIARPEALDTPQMVPRDGPIAAIDTRIPRPSEAGLFDEAVAAALAEQVDPADSDQLASSSPRVVNGGPPVVQVLAVRPSWMRVRGADGSIVFERILDAGETWTLPATEAPPSLHAGNSGSVYFVIDGEAYGPAAPGANVVRNVSLAADSLRDSYQVADLTRDQDLAVHVARLQTTNAD